jgi:hypothetical protein
MEMSELFCAASFFFTLWAIAASIDEGRDQYLLPAIAAVCLVASFLVKP